MMFVVVFLVSVLAVRDSFSLAENEWNSAGKMRDRRDFADLQTQIANAVMLNISDPGVCPATLPCVSGLNKDWCASFCTQNQAYFSQMQSAINTCYLKGLCGKTFTSTKLTNLNVSIPTQTYNGKCFLVGQQVTMTYTQSNAPSVASMDSASTFPGYTTKDNFKYSFNGFSIRCQPCSSATTAASGPPCCGNDLLTIVVCVVQSLLSRLGLNLNILSCKCGCGGKRDVGLAESAVLSEHKRDVGLAESVILSERKRDVGLADSVVLSERQSSGFASSVSLTLTLPLALTTWFPKTADPNFKVSPYPVNASATLTGTQVPAQYAAEIQAGIQNVFMEYGIFRTLANNFGSIVNQITLSFKKTCTTPC